MMLPDTTDEAAESPASDKDTRPKDGKDRRGRNSKEKAEPEKKTLKSKSRTAKALHCGFHFAFENCSMLLGRTKNVFPILFRNKSKKFLYTIPNIRKI